MLCLTFVKENYFSQVKPERILIIRLSAIGDVIHALPCLHALRTKFPQAYIAWVVEDFAAALLRGHPQLDETFIIPKKRWRSFNPGVWYREVLPFIKKLRRHRFDVSFDFQGLTKSSIIGWLANIPFRVGFGDEDGREISRLFNNKKIVPPDTARHVIERNFSLLETVGIHPPIPSPVIPLVPDAVEYSERFLESTGSLGTPLMAVQPGAGWITKEIPGQTLIDVAVKSTKEHGLRTVFTWGPGEKESVQSMVTMVEQRGGDTLIAPSTTVPQLAALLSRCTLMLGGDTGPMHIAAGLGVPVVAVYGGSDAARNAPYGDKHYIIQKTERACVPCWKTRCPLNGDEHLRCLRNVGVKDIMNGIASVLEQSTTVEPHQ